ncbi:MAG: hypothetical protein M9962_04035 [Oligoflexia bacterium]|nr:hypothetical protein [Oligoflexia bacterium]
MNVCCRKCQSENKPGLNFQKRGFFYRTSDSKKVQKYVCNDCRNYFSAASFQICYRQKKRQKNELLRKLLASGNSLRRASLILNIHRTTTVRKFLFLSLKSEFSFRSNNLKIDKASIIQFDDLETFESTKYKPLSVTLAVEHKTRRILGVEVSQMAAHGLIAKKARLRYGQRKDERREGRIRLFKKLKSLITENALIYSDSNPYYKSDVSSYFPKAAHLQYKGRKAASSGLGELKKGYHDPLFSLNHTCAMLRANINRLFRKTWCTTKKPENLYAHLMIYADFHNQTLI